MARTRTTLANALAALALAGCGEDPSSVCSGYIDADRDRFGTPEDVSTSRSGDYSVTTLYWWDRGMSRTYVGTDDGCGVTLGTFPPIE